MAAPLIQKVTNVTKLFSHKHTISASSAILCRNIVGKPNSPNSLPEIYDEEEEFRVLVIPGHTKEEGREKRKPRRQIPAPIPRTTRMPVDQDWTSVWPAASTFKWSAVPFPVRQGYVKGEENDGVPPKKYANAELMKIPNFLHATPAHVKKHCAALKQYCTPWPEELQTEQDIQAHFPIEVTTKEYLFDAPTPRDPRARAVTLNVKLSLLSLNYHARDKFLRLVGDRYNKKTDIVSITSDRCPLKKQNLDFCMYVLTALFHESWTVEEWEQEKTVEDMERYEWDVMPSKRNIVHTLKAIKETKSDSELCSKLQSVPEDELEADPLTLQEVQSYKDAVERLHNDGETLDTLATYKASVEKLLGLNVQLEVN